MIDHLKGLSDEELGKALDCEYRETLTQVMQERDALQARVEALERVRRAACDAIAYLKFGAWADALEVLQQAIDAAMRGEG